MMRRNDRSRVISTYPISASSKYTFYNSQFPTLSNRGRLMSDTNPYASDLDEMNPNAIPRTQPELKLDMTGGMPTTIGIWREGKILAMHKMAVLPDVCIKSNEPTNGYRLKRKLSYHHPAIAIAILVNVLLYIILAAILSNRATVMIGLSDRWRRIRRRRIMIGWGGFLLGCAMFIGGIIMLGEQPPNDAGGFFLIVGIFIGLGFSIYGIFAARLISPKKIDGTYVYIKGAHPDFLDRFESVIR